MVPKTTPKYSGSASSQGELRHDAETSAAASLERPEKLRMRAGVCDFDGAVGKHDFRFQQPGRGRTVLLGKTPKAATLDQPRDANGRAAAALDIAAAPGRNRFIKMPPDRAGAHRDGRLRRDFSGTSIWDKGIVQHDVVHLPRPDQKGIGRISTFPGSYARRL